MVAIRAAIVSREQLDHLCADKPLEFRSSDGLASPSGERICHVLHRIDTADFLRTESLRCHVGRRPKRVKREAANACGVEGLRELFAYASS